MRILSTIQTIRIPIEHDADGNFLEVREVYPETYYFTLKNRTIVRTVENYGDWLDKITENVFQEFKPQQIKCCKNCKHFSFSGMSHSMSGGTAGYCSLVREKLDGATVFDSKTGIWNWCSQFERR